MLSISSGLRFFESKRRKQLVSVLRTVTETEEPHVDLLMNPDDKKRSDETMPLAKAVHSKLNLILTESGMDWTMSRLLVFTGAAFAVGLLLGGLIPFQAPVAVKSGVAACGLAWLPLFYVKRARGKRLDGMEAQLPDALDFLARSMRAGHAFTISLEMVGEEIADPLGQEFRALFNEQNLGASLDRSLANFGKRAAGRRTVLFLRGFIAEANRWQPRRSAGPTFPHYPRTVQAERAGESHQRTRSAHRYHSDGASSGYVGRAGDHLTRLSQPSHY